MSTNNLSTLCAIPWDTDSIHLQGITALPLACLFRCHFCAVGGFQQAAGSPVIKLGCTFGESTKTETSQICLISSAYLVLSFPFVFSPKFGKVPRAVEDALPCTSEREIENNCHKNEGTMHYSSLITTAVQVRL